MSFTTICEIFLLMLRNCGPLFCSCPYTDQEGYEVTELLGLFHNLPFSVVRRTATTIEREWKATFQIDGKVFTFLKDFEDNFYINGEYQDNGEDISDYTLEIINDIFSTLDDYMENLK